MQDDPEIIYSPLCRKFTKDGVSVEVNIFTIENGEGWSLEVVNSANTSTVWDDLFETDTQAYSEFEQTVADEGMVVFQEIEPVNTSIH
jgi:hypothetical protein